MTDPINRMEIDLEATKAYAREKAMTDKLLPCPFCGCSDQKVYDNAVECRSCGASGPDLGHSIGDKARAKSQRNWNRRPVDEAIKASGEDARRWNWAAENCILHVPKHGWAPATKAEWIEFVDAKLAALAAHGRTG